MNYLMSLPELQTLAALQGADRLLLAGQAGPLTRETAVLSVFRLTKRGLLIPDNGGFRCEPEAGALVRRLHRAERCLLATAFSGGLPQLMGYFGPEGGALAEAVPQRPEEYRLSPCQAEAFFSQLQERGYFPGEDAPAWDPEDPPIPPLFGLSLSELSEIPGLRCCLDQLDPETGRLLDRAAVLCWAGTDRLSVNDAPPLPWKQAGLRSLITQWTGGRNL